MGIIWILVTPIALIINTIIREKFKERRIKLLKDIDNTKIKTLANYEQKSRFKEQLRFKLLKEVI